MSNAYYNYIRFGVIWDKAYILIPGVLNEPWYKNGIINPIYIPKHLKVIFGALPKFSKDFPYITPSWAGLAIWITSPGFVYALFARGKKAFYTWISILCVASVVFMHGTTGFIQFGYRFAVDFYPLLMFLVLIQVKEKSLKWHHWILLVVGIIVNSWGVLFINKLGIVSF